MKNVIRGLDDLVYRLQIERADGTEFLLTDFAAFDIAVFTDDCATCYIIESEYIDAAENLIRVPANKIEILNDGIIRLQLLTATDDLNFPDGDYN